MSSNKKESKKPESSNTAPPNQVKKQKVTNESKPTSQKIKTVDNNSKQKTVINDTAKKEIKLAEQKQIDPKVNQSKKQTASTKKLDIPDQTKQKQKTQRSQKTEQKQKSVQQTSHYTQKQDANFKTTTTKKLDKSAQKIHANDDKRKPHDEFQQGDDVLKMSGILDAYEQFLKTLCKYGLPTGDVYEFAAQQIQKFERKKRAKELKLKAEMQIQKAARKKQQLEKQKEQKKPTKL